MGLTVLLGSEELNTDHVRFIWGLLLFGETSAPRDPFCLVVALDYDGIAQSVSLERARSYVGYSTASTWA